MELQQNEIDIDGFVDYRAEYKAVIQKAVISGDSLTGLCPFHEDRNNSFSVDLKTGQWHCFSENIGGNFISFWAKLHGVDNKEAYKQILEKYNIQTAQQEPEKGGSYSVKQYAFEKKIPEEFLVQTFKLETKKDRAGKTYMEIPYFQEDGSRGATRKRYANKDFRWQRGSAGKIGLYGEWALPKFREGGRVVLVEGESDTQALWYLGIPALGCPGASMFKEVHGRRLEGIRALYLHHEQDVGGETFIKKVAEGLSAAGFTGKVYQFTCGHVSGNCKDPSDVLRKHTKEEAAEIIKNLIEKAEPFDFEEAAKEALPSPIQGAPVDLRPPEGWSYSEKGIFKFNEAGEGKLVCRTPIIITRRLKSLETGEEKVEIAFLRDGEWQKAIYPRSTVFTARGVVVLSDLGCTVTSENAKQVVRYLSALEAENIDVIERADATSTFGWQPGGRFIPGHDKGIVLDIEPTQRAIASAYCQNGSFEGWKATMAPHRKRDKFRFILAASFAAPLLRIVRQRIFFVYNWGSSKGGKTAGLKAALSAWGDPERLMVSFNATQVGLERTASFFCDLPLGIDERQLAGKNQDSLEKTIYMIASGTGKVRGSKGGGLQTTHTWRTVALATGEEPISTETSQTGVSTRVLEIYGGPFDNEEEASRMHQEAGLNCGWAGPAFVERLMRIPEDDIRKEFDTFLDFVNGIAGGKSGSHIAGIATVALADAMVESWFFADKPTETEITPEAAARAKEMARAILQEQLDAENGDVNENAVQYITDWILSNRAYFGDDAAEKGTCYGTFGEGGQVCYIYPSTLNEALKKVGFSPRKTLKYMADSGLLVLENSKAAKQRYSITRRFGGRVSRFVAFRIERESPQTADTSDSVEEMADRAQAAADNQYRQESLKFDKNGFQAVPPELEEELPFK